MAQRISKEAGQAGSNLPDKGMFLNRMRVLVLSKQAADSAVAAHRNELKRAKAEGFDPKQMGKVMELRRQDPDIVEQEYKTLQQYAAWAGLPLFTAAVERNADDPLFDLTDKQRAEQLVFLAEQAGYSTGRAGGSRTDANTHAPGTETHVAWDAGWLRGQTAIAMEMGPNATPKKGTRGKGSNPEDAPAGKRRGGKGGSTTVARDTAATVASADPASEPADDETSPGPVF